MFRFFATNKRPAHKPAPRRRTRLELEALEERSLLSVTTNTITGTAFLDANSNGVFDPKEVAEPGITVNLTGTTNLGKAENVSTTTDINGKYTFNNVPTGTYQLNASGPGLFQTGAAATVTVAEGQSVIENLAVGGIAPQFISLRQFLTDSNTSVFAPGSPGGGSAAVGPRSNSPPTVASAISDFTLAKNDTTGTVLDLAGVFTDPDLTNSEVQFETAAGPINLTLFDAQAPRTVANFYNYINAGLYNNDIFHRRTVASDGLQVLQGGGFTLTTTNGQSSLPAVTTFPSVLNEPDFTTRSNLADTIAMAKTSDPNSATSQFFFNLVDNSSSLDSTSNSGGFTVFGMVADATSIANMNALAAIPNSDQSSAPGLPSSEQGVFNEIPLQNYTGTNFPTDTTAANYALIQGVKILSRPEFLTYSVVSNSNPNLVTATLGTGDNNRLTVAATPNGGTGTATITVRATDTFGATVDDTFKVSVVNEPPTVAVTLSSTSPQTNDTLTATATPSDPNKDPVQLTYAWSVNGTVVQTDTTNATTDTFDLSKPGHGDKGQTITVVVTPNDGTVNGAAATATATVVNAPPVINSLVLTPASPSATDTLTATVTDSDPDGDPVKLTYVWALNGSTVKTTNLSSSTTDTLDLSSLSGVSAGSTITVTVTPNDGTTNGTAKNTNAVVVGPRSTSTVLTANPSSVVPGGILTLTAKVSASDNSTPTGNVSFFDSTTNVNLGVASLTGGVATLYTRALTVVQNDTITATYAGDSQHDTSTDMLIQPVVATTLPFSLTDSQWQTVPVSGRASNLPTLRDWDVTVGTGATLQVGQQFTASYTGYLPNGTVFDSSNMHGGPQQFTLSTTSLIAGWVDALPGLKVGGEIRLDIPADLAYGNNPPSGIPANSELVFDITLVSIP